MAINPRLRPSYGSANMQPTRLFAGGMPAPGANPFLNASFVGPGSGGPIGLPERRYPGQGNAMAPGIDIPAIAPDEEPTDEPVNPLYPLYEPTPSLSNKLGLHEGHPSVFNAVMNDDWGAFSKAHSGMLYRTLLDPLNLHKGDEKGNWDWLTKPWKTGLFGGLFD